MPARLFEIAANIAEFRPRGLRRQGQHAAERVRADHEQRAQQAGTARLLIKSLRVACVHHLLLRFAHQFTLSSTFGLTRRNSSTACRMRRHTSLKQPGLC